MEKYRHVYNEKKLLNSILTLYVYNPSVDYVKDFSVSLMYDLMSDLATYLLYDSKNKVKTFSFINRIVDTWNSDNFNMNNNHIPFNYDYSGNSVTITFSDNIQELYKNIIEK